MILADTLIWIDHFRHGDVVLAELLQAQAVLMHPFIIGELALGALRQRDAILDDLRALPRAQIATDGEVLRFITQHTLSGQGIGYVDAHLLAATRLTPNCRLWTRDKRLHTVATLLAMTRSGDTV